MKLEVLEAFCVAFWVRGQAFSGSCIGGCILNFTDTLRHPSTLFADTRCWNHVFCVRRSFDASTPCYILSLRWTASARKVVFSPRSQRRRLQTYDSGNRCGAFQNISKLLSLSLWHDTWKILKMCSSSSPFGTKIHLVAVWPCRAVVCLVVKRLIQICRFEIYKFTKFTHNLSFLAVHSNASWFDLDRRHQDTPRWYSRFIHPHWQVSWQKMYLILFNWFWLFVFGCFFVHSFVVFGMLLTSLLYVAVTWNNLHWDLQWDVQVWFSRLRAGRLLLGFPPLRCPRRR